MLPHKPVSKLTVGRYAPSPTGRLHLGNLRTALLSWLQVRLAGGRFLLRMEDLDQPRVVAGSDVQILRDLEWLGLDWDGSVLRQSERTAAYAEALDTLASANLVYPCYCSRKDLRTVASAPHGKTGVYPGTCADLDKQAQIKKGEQKSPSLRVRVPDRHWHFFDVVAGEQHQNLRQEVGDFVVKRADGLFAYQLAVVVDDLHQGVTDVLRGSDLLDSTVRQLYLADLLREQTALDREIRYWHVPLLRDDSGQRLAKRDGSDSLIQWQEVGKTAAMLIGKFALQLGFIDKAAAITAQELLRELSPDSFVAALKKHGQ